MLGADMNSTVIFILSNKFHATQIAKQVDGVIKCIYIYSFFHLIHLLILRVFYAETYRSCSVNFFDRLIVYLSNIVSKFGFVHSQYLFKHYR